MEQTEHPIEIHNAPVFEHGTPNTGSPDRNQRQAELSSEVRALFTNRGSLPSDPSTREAPVKVISYMGSASNKIGNNGDFYLDEMTNVLYGPKSGDVWPEEGIEVDGPVLCKRNFIQLNPARIAGRRRVQADHPKPPGVLVRLWYFALRLVRFSKSPHSLTLQN